MMEDNSFRSPHHHDQQLGLHDHAERHATLLRWQPSGKSKLAALLSFMVSPSPLPSPRASFRKEKKLEAPSTTRQLRQAETAAPAAAGGETKPANHTYNKKGNSPSSSSRESISMQLQGVFGVGGAHHDDELDLGVATGDRRLQGITVVRGSGGDEERWVVRCVPVPAGPSGACWDDEERREKVVDEESATAPSEQQNIIKDDELVEIDEQLQGDDDGGGNIDDPPSHSWDSDSSSDLFDLDLEYR